MKYIVILPLLFLSFFLSAHPSDSRQDDKVFNMPDGEDKLEALYLKSKNSESPEDALFYVSAQRDLAQKLDNQLYLAKAYSRIGLLQKNKGYLGQAILNYRKAIDLFIRLEEPLHLADNLMYIGNIYLSAKEYSNALKHFHKALEIYKQSGDQKLEAMAYRNIAFSYAELRDDQLAFDNYKKSLDIEVNYNNNYALYDINTGLGDLYKKRGEYELARNHFLASIDFDDLKNDPLKKGMAYNNVGETYLEEGNFSEAEQWFNKSIDIKKTEENKDTRSLIYTLNNMGVLKYKMGQYESSINSFDKAIKLTKEGIIYPLSAKNVLYLDSALQAAKPHLSKEQAFDYYNIYSNATRFQAQQIILLSDLKAQLETLMKQNLIKINLEIPELNNQLTEANQEKTYREIAAYLLAFSLLVTAYYLYKNGRKVYLTNKLLAEELNNS